MAIATIADKSTTTINDGFGAYNDTVTGILIQHTAAGAHKSAGDVVLKALFDANTILYATTDDTPAALTIAASRILGRGSSGAIAALTATQVNTILGTVIKTDFDANTILAANSGDTPVALTIAVSRIVGRKSSGNIGALTAAEVLTILGLEADLANLTEAEVDQLEAIGTKTISNAQWGYLGACGAGGGKLLAALTTGESTQIEAIGSTTISATQWGYLGALTTHPIGGDGTAGRILRGINISIADGSNANTVKCSTASVWNGDIIGEVDNISKGATTGDFELSADGTSLKILASGLTGNAVFAFGLIYKSSTNELYSGISIVGNDIDIGLTVASSWQDISVVADAGTVNITIFYITDA